MMDQWINSAVYVICAKVSPWILELRFIPSKEMGDNTTQGSKKSLTMGVSNFFTRPNA